LISLPPLSLPDNRNLPAKITATAKHTTITMFFADIFFFITAGVFPCIIDSDAMFDNLSPHDWQKDAPSFTLLPHL
jgi:hypothetical protein